MLHDNKWVTTSAVAFWLKYLFRHIHSLLISFMRIIKSVAALRACYSIPYHPFWKVILWIVHGPCTPSNCVCCPLQVAGATVAVQLEREVSWHRRRDAALPVDVKRPSLCANFRVTTSFLSTTYATDTTWNVLFLWCIIFNVFLICDENYFLKKFLCFSKKK